jgi:hypothetical protein
MALLAACGPERLLGGGHVGVEVDELDVDDDSGTTGPELSAEVEGDPHPCDEEAQDGARGGADGRISEGGAGYISWTIPVDTALGLCNVETISGSLQLPPSWDLGSPARHSWSGQLVLEGDGQRVAYASPTADLVESETPDAGRWLLRDFVWEPYAQTCAAGTSRRAAAVVTWDFRRRCRVP